MSITAICPGEYFQDICGLSVYEKGEPNRVLALVWNECHARAIVAAETHFPLEYSKAIFSVCMAEGKIT